MDVFTEIRPVTLREQVVHQVRTAIIEGRLKPEDHITEVSLTEQMGVSRTPAREALILLEREGLVTVIPNRGCFVRAFGEQDVDEIFTMRTALENLAAEANITRLDAKDHVHLNGLIDEQSVAISRGNIKEVRRIDMAFHQYLVQACENRLLSNKWHEIVAQIAALLYVRAESFPDYDEYLAVRDHRAILAAYGTGNVTEVFRVNRRVNERVKGECKAALRAR